MSTVNLAEVMTWLYENDWSTTEIEIILDGLPIRELPFNSAAALLTGKLRKATKELGLGLGDRACLATGYIEGCPVLTADQAWQELDIDNIKVQCIR